VRNVLGQHTAELSDWCTSLISAHGSEPSLASRSGTVSTVNPGADLILTSSHNSGVETGARPYGSARGIGPDGCRAPAVAQIINIMRPFRAVFAMFAMKSSGRCATKLSATHLAKALTSSQPRFATNGITTCKPLPPVVLTKLFRPTSRSASRRCAAASVTRHHGKPPSGSRSNVTRSGLSGCFIVDPQGWISTTSIWTSATRPGNLDKRIDLGHGCVFELKEPNCVGCLGTNVFLAKYLPADRGRPHNGQQPVGERGQSPRGNCGVIAGNVEFGQHGAGIKDAVGMGQPYPLKRHAALAAPLRVWELRGLWRSSQRSSAALLVPWQAPWRCVIAD
jgi:hypothetical protein